MCSVYPLWGTERENRMQNAVKWKKSRQNEKDGRAPSSGYLLAKDDRMVQRQKELLYEVLGPVFFGEKEAESEEELAAFFREQYGIDVRNDFYEGDEHYEEYREAQQAIAEGLSIYGGRISFGNETLADLAEQIWEDMEEDGGGFRRINTMLEE